MQLFGLRPMCFMALTMLGTLGYTQTSPFLIYGAENAKHFRGSETKYYYIVISGFISEHEAHKVHRYIDSPFISFKIRPYQGAYFVRLGPIYSAEEVRAIGEQLSRMPVARAKMIRPVRHIAPVKTNTWFHRTRTIQRTKPVTPSKRDWIETTRPKPKPVSPTRTVGWVEAPRPKPNNTPTANVELRHQGLNPTYGARTSLPTTPVKSIKPTSMSTTKAMTASMKDSLSWLAGHRVFSISGGAAWAQNSGTQTLYLQPIVFQTYATTPSTETVGVADVFLGLQYDLPHKLQGQIGLALGVTSNINRSGNIWEQALRDFDNYTYSYTINQTRIALKGKLITAPMYYQLSPYVSATAGIALNKASGFISTPKIEEESEQPPFASNTSTSFTYTLGAGIQRAINSNWSVAGGYEFSDLGKSELGRAAEQTMNQGPGLSHLYTNGIIISLTYVG